MKSKISIKSIIVMSIIIITSMLFINMSLATTTGKINVETANLREMANAESKILEQLSLNQEVEILEKSGEWYQVQYNGITGFIKQDLITTNEEIKPNDENTIEQKEATQNTQTTEPKNENQETEQKDEMKNKDTDLGKHKVSKNVKLKIIPSINATETIDVKQNEEVNVVEIMNGWACVEVQNTKGWIRQENLQKEEQESENAQTNQEAEKQENQPTEVPQEAVPEQVIKTQYINTATANLRKEPNTNSEIVTSFALNTLVEVYSESNGWSKVKVSGKEGYISTSLLSNKKQETSRGTETTRRNNSTNKTQANTTTKKEVATNSSGSATGNSIIAYAKQFIGVPYKYGGTTPSGFDCSGFTSYVYKHFGISLPRTSGGQSKVGKAVSRANLAPGDLVIYSGHVAIYVGGGNVIHAPRPGKSVCIVSIDNAGYGFAGGRRVV